MGLERSYAATPPKEVSVDSRQALSQSMEQYAGQWAQARSAHYAGSLPAAERSAEQARSLAQLSPQDQTMFARIRAGVPAHVADDTVAHAMLQAKQAGIVDAGKIGQAGMTGDRLGITGVAPGFRAAVDASAQAPSLQETVRQTQALDQQREQPLAMETQQRDQQQQAQGRGFPA